eukprot:CAMPEP_0185282510 /NCGR_PEP_ID=MMETSP1359-20130426/67316_1 /TAXON_ID=552665 /ORGANISM="Bigelowiella longifila, Strain CCMP242" /LENGTH=42 /DNA_ID= /DNA_START= /DNA_END= /DNA_ORIENTATION=
MSRKGAGTTVTATAAAAAARPTSNTGPILGGHRNSVGRCFAE